MLSYEEFKKKFKKDPTKKLSDRHKAMIDLYFGFAKFEKLKAARMAGFKNPEVNLVRLFNEPVVVAEIERRQAENRRKYNITYDNVMQEMAKIGFANIAKFMTWHEDTGEFIGFNLTKEQIDDYAAIGEITVETYMEGKGDDAEEVKKIKIKPWNKQTALEALIRHAGLSHEKNASTLEVEIVDRLRQGRERVFGRDKKED